MPSMMYKHADHRSIFRQLGILILLCSSQVSFAASEFSLNWAKTDPARESFIWTLESLTPDSMKQVIGRRIELEFGRERDFSPIGWGSCSDQASYDSDNLARIDSSLSKITLNPDLRSATASSSPKPSCRHGTDYNLALAAVLHELANAYDLQVEADPALRFQIAKACAKRETESCRSLRSIHRLVSDRSPFMKLMNFNSGWVVPSNKQRTDQRPEYFIRESDSRFLESPQKAFTAAVEDFLIRPDFRCTNPGIYEFLAALLKKRPRTQSCGAGLRVPLYNLPGKSVNLDPKHVYRIEYAYVRPGHEARESFGHGMLRVIACDPKRSAPGPECLEDTRFHYILTFYGDSDSIARLFAYDSALMLDDYVNQEARSIEFVPLNLSRQELTVLLATALEWNRNYRGRWYDLTNNCVTQVLDLLRAAIPSLEYQTFPIITPSSLANRLKELPIYKGPSILAEPK